MAQYDVLLMLGQSNAMGFFPPKTQAEIDALNPDPSIWQLQYYPTYNDGAVKYQQIYPADSFISRDYIQFWEFQNKWGEIYNDVSTSYAQKSPQTFVNYYVETDVNGKHSNSMWYNNNSAVYDYPFSWDLPYALSMYKYTEVPQRIVKIAIGAAAITNGTAQNFKTDTVTKPNDNLYQRCLDEIASVKSYFSSNGDTIRKWKILWEQGEANNTTAVATYETEWQAIIDGLRTEIGDSTVQVIIRKTGLDADDSNNAGTAQEARAVADSYTYCWNDYSFTSNASPGDFNNIDLRAKYYRLIQDQYHISPLGLWRMGLNIASWVQTNVSGY